MTTVEQVAPIEPVAATAPVPGASRLIGGIAVGAALLSATATFLVMAGLTPIVPVDAVELYHNRLDQPRPDWVRR